VRYRYHIDQIGADQIVILNYINDFFDIMGQVRLLKEAREKKLFSEAQTAIIQCDKASSPKLVDILNYSHLFRFVNEIRNSNKFSSDNERGRKLLDSLFRIGFKPDVDLLTDSTFYPEIRSLYRELLVDIAHKRKVLVVHIPPDYQVDQQRAAELARLFPGVNINPSLINVLLKDVTEGIPNLTFLDLTEEIRKYNTHTKLYIKYDGHLNERGQSVIGGLISEAIRNENSDQPLKK
jgi:hypothetical protein